MGDTTAVARLVAQSGHSLGLGREVTSTALHFLHRTSSSNTLPISIRDTDLLAAALLRQYSFSFYSTAFDVLVFAF